LTIKINSKEPYASFKIIKPSKESPNTILLDATASYDPDTFDSSKLTFNWTID
jgi:hypothetical protein